MFNILMLIATLASFSSTMLAARKIDDTEFVILITSYNNKKYAKENLKSACHQKSTRPYQVICVNDCSTDETGAIMDQYVQKHHLESFVKIIHNPVRVGALENIYNVIHTLIADDKVVVSLDGDDRLAHDEVLLRLEKVYSDPHVWMTYGNSLTIPGGRLWCKEVPKEAFLQGKLRQIPFEAQHLRTFKAWLFKKIAKADLMYEGKFFPMTWDMAIMFPMLEMAGPKDAQSVNHSRFIKQVLYFYRMNNPLNDFRVNDALQTKLGKIIIDKIPYKPLKSLSTKQERS